MKITPFFANLLLEDRLNIDNHALRDYCLRMQTMDAGRGVSNVNGWQSNDIDLADPELAPLITQLKSRVKEMCDAYAIRKEIKFTIENGWININKQGGWNTPHCHSGAFSAVYYAWAQADQGALQLVDRDNAKTSLFNPATVHSFNGANSSNYTITPMTGRLVIFPSWVLHYVESNPTDSERISLAFNITLPRL
jgi:uncharacterized protein (TIGR02466 family)